jgi:RimJ/RimL family protein N-acetyltransferase
MVSQARHAGPTLAVRHILSAEHARLRELRLSALERNPEAFGSTYAGDAAQPVAWWQRWASASEDGVSERTFVLVDSQDRWLGMAFARFRGEKPGVAWLGGMSTSPEARGRGAALLLCRACIRWLTDRGADELMLTVVVGNDVALRAYETAGFVIRERTTHSYEGRTLDEFVMARAVRGSA